MLLQPLGQRTCAAEPKAEEALVALENFRGDAAHEVDQRSDVRKMTGPELSPGLVGRNDPLDQHLDASAGRLDPGQPCANDACR